MIALTESSDRTARVALAAYLAFTAVAVAGYGTFGRHPELLGAYPGLAPFYGVAFRFFAQAHLALAALVLVYTLVRQAGAKWVAGAVLVYVVSLLSELAGTSTGLPFGAYSYSGLLGWKWFDLVPALIPLSWYVMALPAFVLARHRFRSAPMQLLFGAVLLTAWDLALDPAMSALTNYWSWEDGGPYYGMPLLNLGGWMVTGIVLMAILRSTSRSGWLHRMPVRWCASYYGVTVLMPLGMLAVAGAWTAAAISLLACGGLVLFALSTAKATRAPGTRARAHDERRPRRGPASQAHSAAAGCTDSAADSTADSAEEVVSSDEALSFVHARAAEAEGACVTFFARHSRSFSFAARWFSAEDRRMVAGLYAFCRTTDDLADRSEAEDAATIRQRLDAWECLADRAYKSADTGIAWLDRIMATSAGSGVPIELVHDLIRGVRMDVGPVRMKTWDDLDVYMYRVASVVGVWMCRLFGVHDAGTHARAIALGRAMQLTNILRDVGEDLDEDRIYIPAEVLHRYDLEERHLHTVMEEVRNGRCVPPKYQAMMNEMIGRADAYYAYAGPGFASLPPAFARAAAVAAEVYHGIHRELRRNGFDNLQRRAHTSSFSKIVLAGRALRRLAVQTSTRGRGSLAPVKNVRKAAASSAAIVLIGLFGAGPALASDCPALPEVRAQYIHSVEQESRIDATRRAIADCDAPVYRAYDGALVVLEGKHAFWPPSKLKYVREGLGVLDELVDAYPEAVEIRYLRLLSGFYLPSFIGRRGEVRADFGALAELLPASRDRFPAELYEMMVDFVLSNGDPNDESRQALRASIRPQGDGAS